MKKTDIGQKIQKLNNNVESIDVINDLSVDLEKECKKVKTLQNAVQEQRCKATAIENELNEQRCKVAAIENELKEQRCKAETLQCVVKEKDEKLQDLMKSNHIGEDCKGENIGKKIIKLLHIQAIKKDLGAMYQTEASNSNIDQSEFKK